eukprot:15065281-Alexandrium_andersonii.AAC.1
MQSVSASAAIPTGDANGSVGQLGTRARLSTGGAGASAFGALCGLAVTRTGLVAPLRCPRLAPTPF